MVNSQSCQNPQNTNRVDKWLVSWNLTSLFSTNTAISEMKGGQTKATDFQCTTLIELFKIDLQKSLSGTMCRLSKSNQRGQTFVVVLRGELGIAGSMSA